VKEIPVEKIVTKTEYVTDDTKVNELIKKIEELESKEPEVIEKIVEVIKEVPVEVTKEVIVEKIIEKNNDDKMKMLQETLQSLRKELNLKNEKIKQLEQSLKDLESLATSKGAVFLKNSNLNENL
jgi:mevalonate kinase